MDDKLPTNQGVTGDEQSRLKKLESELDQIGAKARQELETQQPAPTQQPPVAAAQPSPLAQPPSEPLTPAPPPAPKVPETPPAQPPSPTPPMPPSGTTAPAKKKPKIVLWVAVGLLAISLLATAVYFLTIGKSMLSKTTPTPTPIPLPTPTSTPTPTPEPTAGWEVYTNEVASLSFKHPADWLVEPYEVTGRSNMHGVAALKVQGQEYGPEPGAITIVYWDNPDELSIKEFDEENGGESGETGLYYSSVQEKTLAGVTARFTTEADCSPVLCSKYVVSHNKMIFDISIYTSVTEDLSTTIDQILETFEFTSSEHTPTATPSGGLNI